MATIGALTVVIDGNSVKYIQELQKSQNATKGFVSNTDSSMKRIGSFFSSAAGTIAKVGTAVTAIGTIVAGFTVHKIIGQFAEFETQIARLTQVGIKDLGEMSKKILELPASLGSAAELTSGFYEVLSNGIEGTARQLETLTISSKLAKASHLDQDTAVQAVTAGMKAFNATAEEVANSLLKIEATGASGTTVATLAPLYGEVAGAAESMGVKMDEAGAALAAMTQLSGSVEKGQTKLIQVFRELLKETPEMEAAFSDLGGTMNAMKTIGLEGVLQRIKEKSGGTAEGIKALGVQGEITNAFVLLLRDNMSAFNTAMDAQANKSGALEEAWKSYEATINSMWITFKNTVGNMAVVIGAELAPKVKEALESVKILLEDNKENIIAWAEKWIEKIPDIGKTIESLSNSISTALGVISTVFSAVGTVVSGVWEILSAFPSGVVGNLSEVAKAAKESSDKFTSYFGEVQEAVKISEEKVKSLQVALEKKTEMNVDIAILEWQLAEAKSGVEEWQRVVEVRTSLGVDVSEASIKLYEKQQEVESLKERITTKDELGIDIESTRTKLQEAQAELEKTKGIFEELKETAKNFHQPTSWEELLEFIKWVSSGIKDGIIINLKDIGNTFAYVVGAVFEGLKLIGTQVKNVGEMLWSALTLDIDGVKKNFGELLTANDNFTRQMEINNKAYVNQANKDHADHVDFVKNNPPVGDEAAIRKSYGVVREELEKNRIKIFDFNTFFNENPGPEPSPTAEDVKKASKNYDLISKEYLAYRSKVEAVLSLNIDNREAIANLNEARNVAQTLKALLDEQIKSKVDTTDTQEQLAAAMEKVVELEELIEELPEETVMKFTADTEQPVRSLKQMKGAMNGVAEAAEEFEDWWIGWEDPTIDMEESAKNLGDTLGTTMTDFNNLMLVAKDTGTTFKELTRIFEQQSEILHKNEMLASADFSGLREITIAYGREVVMSVYAVTEEMKKMAKEAEEAYGAVFNLKDMSMDDLVSEIGKAKKAFEDLPKKITIAFALEGKSFSSQKAYDDFLRDFMFGTGDSVPKFATGGSIYGPSHSSGGVFLNAEGGEYMIPKDVVSSAPMAYWENIRQGNLPGYYADGGIVGWQDIPYFDQWFRRTVTQWDDKGFGTDIDIYDYDRLSDSIRPDLIRSVNRLRGIFQDIESYAFIDSNERESLLSAAYPLRDFNAESISPEKLFESITEIVDYFAKEKREVQTAIQKAADLEFKIKELDAGMSSEIGTARDTGGDMNLVRRSLSASSSEITSYIRELTDLRAIISQGSGAIPASNFFSDQFSRTNSSLYRELMDAFPSVDLLGSFAAGTGLAGLPKTGLFMGHQGEIVLNKDESEDYADDYTSGLSGASRPRPGQSVRNEYYDVTINTTDLDPSRIGPAFIRAVNFNKARFGELP